MDQKLYELADLTIWKRGDRYFVRYDAGAHQVTMREDELSEAEVALAIQGKEATNQMLLALEKRLIKAGIDPHVANLD
ncbi:hypothetical protein [Massilia sp. MS-15]|uniref:hypothetical protein n=1 Tax=Massilia sp. MS-15 TaxID=2878200 RepID=UPI001CD24E92|nr:hypothetical protein [Massilia sp. MS-15]MCA1246037.1 hypothetical protein [Massilia sp. MS-15]